MPKDIRYLCKRRKNQLINCEINLHANSNSLSSVTNKACNIEEAVLNYKENNNMSCTNSILFKDSNRFHELSFEMESNINSNEVEFDRNSNEIKSDTSSDEEH